MQTIEHNNKKYTVQFSNFRESHDDARERGYAPLPGCHGLNIAACKACVRATLAAVIDATDGKIYTGIAYRSSSDNFVNKVGKAIASGRAIKCMTDQFHENNVRHTATFADAEKYVEFLRGLRSLEKVDPFRMLQSLWAQYNINASL